MVSTDTDAIMLVPGLFGFDRVTPDLPGFNARATPISYFDQVADRLHDATGIASNRILVHRTLPTGPLAFRVKSLYEHVEQVIEGRAGYDPAQRVHLIGHSTGGLDVRLLVNGKFVWPGGPAGDKRLSLLSRLGSVVSISAPHHGTPIARRCQGAMEMLIPELFLLSALAKYEEQTGVRPSGQAVFAQARLLRAALSAPGRARIIPRPPSSEPEPLSMFLDTVVNDRVLIHELTPYAMARLNATIRGGETTKIRDIVTVAPPPALEAPWHPVRGLQRALYASAFTLTRPAFDERKPFPAFEGWIGAEERRLETDDASDGIVPAWSQVSDGKAAAIVAGDHLDVVGHFASRRFAGVTLFNSGASFDDERFDELWRTVSRFISDKRLGREPSRSIPRPPVPEA